ncbi:hypothetical protein [Candidatus Collinsella stercoripullorum]|uniref:hypothetical protein n=1 Tax=Candidatus Collinsella stercoripullorum TaxID=2838522 RepID=UPI0022E33AAB|nr:hypothetical protein [Candidatus Collinsella stercoripullorum]
MLNLIKSDLYRITRARGLRGSFWQYSLAIVAAYAAVVALLVFVRTQAYDMLADGAASPFTSEFPSYTAYLADMASGIVPLCVCFMVAEHVLQEFKGGYARTVLSARAGRLSYFVGKAMFAGVLSAIMMLLSIAIVTVGAWIGGYTFALADTPIEFLGWFGGFWLNIWALAVLSLILVYATRVSPVSYIGAFCFCFGTVPSSLRGLAYATRDILPALEPIRPVFETLAAWLPSSSLGNLKFGGGLFWMSPADVWGASSQALTVAPGVQALIAGVIWVAIPAAVVLLIARERDI